MKIAIVTGAAGLIGSEAARFFAARGFGVVGVDNDLRRSFFGDGASTRWNRDRLVEEVPGYRHYDLDIRDGDAMGRVFAEYGSDIAVVIHAAAQPSHDWAAKEPLTDFGVNAVGTLVLLEHTRRYCPDAVFIFTSTNKVYGDAPNRLPLVELATRWEISPDHQYHARGIDETLTIDRSTHSIFGVSKAAADLMVQEYGRYFGMKTVAFRGGCLTGPNHSGAQLHGFLAYLMQCTLTGTPYVVNGYKGKQVRDNIHSFDLVNMFWHFYQQPRAGEVYNAGGSRFSCCSMLEAIALCEEIAGRKLSWSLQETPRVGDHIWWISDVSRFQSHYPEWRLTYSLQDTLLEMCDGMARRLREPAGRAPA